MGGAIPPLPQYVFIAWCLVKYRDNFTLYMLKRKLAQAVAFLVFEKSRRGRQYFLSIHSDDWKCFVMGSQFIILKLPPIYLIPC
jgi:hypothetical protein